MHFAKVTQEYAAANKLCEAIQKTVKKYNRTLINPEDLATFKASLVSDINKLNAAFPRCKPVKASWWTTSLDGSHNKNSHHEIDWVLSIDGAPQIVHFILYASKSSYKKQ